MSSVKSSISLPKNLANYAMKRCRQQARARGQHPNFSGFIAELVVQAKAAEERTVADVCRPAKAA